VTLLASPANRGRTLARAEEKIMPVETVQQGQSNSSLDLSDLASMDEYDLSLNDGVQDETLLGKPSEKKFSIESYGADYTVDSLVERMKKGAFIIPDFQRKFVWTIRHASKFIESLLMGLPVPGIFLYKEAGTNKHLVIDGQQRLKTLQAFYDKKFRGQEFRLVGVRECWAGKTYAELDPSDALKLDDSIVHATIFKQDEPKDVLESIYFVFERINTGGIRLSPQEIRNCITRGPFSNAISEMNKDSNWRAVFGRPHKRAKDEELIVRFLALFENGANYAEPMNDFLNAFSARMNRAMPTEINRLDQLFRKTIAVVYGSIGERAFRPHAVLNAAVFDSVMVGLCTRLCHGEPPTNGSVSSAYDRLLSNDDFLKFCERSTADRDNVESRLNIARNAFAGA
jgi:hypothetical protein